MSEHQRAGIPRRHSKPVPLASLLKRWTQQRPRAQRDAGTDWDEFWAETAGEPLARYSRPMRVRQRKLVIEVDSAVLLQELQQFRKAQLLKELQERVPGRIEDLEFRLRRQSARH